MWIEISLLKLPTPRKKVTPFAGVWIEMCCQMLADMALGVTPFAGVWIEIRRIPCE